MTSTLDEFELSNPRLLPGSTLVNGLAVKTLAVVVSSGKESGTWLLLVRAHGSPLPVRESYVYKNGAPSPYVASFGPWDIALAPKAPGHSVPFASTGD